MESGISISVPYQIDVVKCYNHDFGDGIKQHLFVILFFARIKNIFLKNLIELPINTTFDLKFSCSTGHEWNLVYNGK